MTAKKNTKKAPKTQDNVTPILQDRFTYNVTELEDFLQRVFHTELEPDEEILAWISKGIPGYPITEEALYKKLPRTPVPKSLYYGTSTTIRNPEGELRNRKALFKRLHVIVLDDIGTKIPVDKIPKELIPTYIIETSKGNFQYGLVLETPIDDPAQADLLIQIVYDAGISDGGGKLINKLVRLPDGVNGKPGEKGQFQVNLVSFTDRLWKPEDILNILDTGVTWDEVVADAEGVSRRRANVSTGVTPWMTNMPSCLPALNGVIDPVLSWLYEQKMVEQETNEWVRIKCPWSDLHTSGDSTAHYSPLGWGGAAYQNYRNFHCFHDHCSDKKGHDLLQYVVANNGPEAAGHVYAAHLTSRFVYDQASNGVWDMKTPARPFFITIEAFKNTYIQKAYLHTRMKEKPVVVRESQLFLEAVERVTVAGQTYDPTTQDKIITTRHASYPDQLWVNTYTTPKWGKGSISSEHVKRFKQFLSYLVPDKEAQEFFYDWIAAKAQDMAFRGPAILMIAPEQGTGRTTLGNMITTLFGMENVEKVPFGKLSGDSQFNEWLVSPIIITDETLALGAGANYYKVYERIKELIDTSPELVTINEKFKQPRQQMVYSSYLLFSNHEDAMKVAGNDRRIHVIDNAPWPAKPEYFQDLNDWLKDKEWARSVWRWLQERKVDVPALLAPAKMTQAKQKMTDATKQPVDVAIEAIMEFWPCKVISTKHVKDILDKHMHRLNLSDNKFANAAINRVVRQNTIALPDARKLFVVGSERMRLKLVKIHLKDQDRIDFLSNHKYESLALAEAERFPKDLTSINAEVVKALDNFDF